MPDPLRVSLTEVDRRWSYIRSGKEYHGEAINPWNLSFFERWIGHGRSFNRAKDEEDRQAASRGLLSGFIFFLQQTVMNYFGRHCVCFVSP